MIQKNIKMRIYVFLEQVVHGKSYFTKVFIIRNRLIGVTQYVIDPDREYSNISNKLGGVIIKIGPASNTYINILDIRRESLEEDQSGYLATKISKLMGFFDLIFGGIDEEEKAILEEKIIQAYFKKGITFNDESLYKKIKINKQEKKVFKEEKDMPILEDLYNILGENIKTRKLHIKLIPFIKGSLKFFNQHTNIKLKNKLIIADIYELGEENLKYGMYIFTDFFWDQIKRDRKELKAIYIDEIWRLIGITSNKIVASFIYKIFKTIRKYGGSAVGITQDISDLFSLEEGIYGKSILNNSSIKTFFALEEENIKILSEVSSLTEKEKIEIKSLKTGECLMHINQEHILMKVESSEYEEKIVKGGKYD